MSMLQPYRAVSLLPLPMKNRVKRKPAKSQKRIHIEDFFSSHFMALSLKQCEVVLHRKYLTGNMVEVVDAFLKNNEKHYLFIFETEDLSRILESLNLTKNRILSTEVELNVNDLLVVDGDSQDEGIVPSKLRVLKKLASNEEGGAAIKLRCQPVLDTQSNSIDIVNIFPIESDKNVGAMTLSGQFDAGFQLLCDQAVLAREFERVICEIDRLLAQYPNIHLHFNVPFNCNNEELVGSILKTLQDHNIESKRLYWVFHEFTSAESRESLTQQSRENGFKLICHSGVNARVEPQEDVSFVLSHNEHGDTLESQTHSFLARNLGKTFQQKAYQEKTQTLKHIIEGEELSSTSLYYFPAVACDSIEELVIEQAWVQSSIETLITKLNYEHPQILLYVDLEDEVPDVLEQLLKDIPTAVLLRCIEDVKMLASEADILIALSYEIRAVQALQEQYRNLKAIVLEDTGRMDDMHAAPIFDTYLIDTYDMVSPYQLFLSRILRKVERKRQLAESNNVALESMKQASQYGAIVEFCKTTFQLETAQELMHGITHFFDMQYGLKIAVMFKDMEQNHYHSYGHQNCPELVQRVLQLVHQKGRIYHYQDNRLVFNDEDICILVLNAPQEEAELGRIKDSGSAVVTMVGEKWKECRDKQALRLISKQLRSISLDVGRLTVGMKERQDLVLNEFVNRIHESFHKLDFTVEQEDFLLELGGNMAQALNFKSDLDELQELILGVLHIAKRN